LNLKHRWNPQGCCWHRILLPCLTMIISRLTPNKTNKRRGFFFFFSLLWVTTLVVEYWSVVAIIHSHWPKHGPTSAASIKVSSKNPSRQKHLDRDGTKKAYWWRIRIMASLANGLFTGQNKIWISRNSNISASALRKKLFSIMTKFDCLMWAMFSYGSSCLLFIFMFHL